MLEQQEEAKRQSSLLLRSAGSDSQILEMLQELGKLRRELEETRREQRERVRGCPRAWGHRGDTGVASGSGSEPSIPIP